MTRYNDDASSTSDLRGRRSPPSTPLRCGLDLLNATVFTAMIVIGVVKWNMCHIEPFVPKCVFGAGVACMLIFLLDKARLCFDSRSAFPKFIEPFLKFALCSALLVALVALTVLLGKSGASAAAKGAKGGSSAFCDQMLYGFAVFVIVLFAVEAVAIIAYKLIRISRKNDSSNQSA